MYRQPADKIGSPNDDDQPPSDLTWKPGVILTAQALSALTFLFHEARKDLFPNPYKPNCLKSYFVKVAYFCLVWIKSIA